MNVYMPKDRVYVPELDIWGTVVGVYIGVTGTEYRVRYFKDEVPYEVLFCDFELSDGIPTNA